MRTTTIPATILAACAALLVSGAATAAGNGPSFIAVVDSDGTLARGLNATGASHPSTGQYEVDFTKDVSGCAYTGTIGLSGTAGASAPGTLNVIARAHDKKAIFVQTYNVSAVLADLGFHVIVSC